MSNSIENYFQQFQYSAAVREMQAGELSSSWDQAAKEGGNIVSSDGSRDGYAMDNEISTQIGASPGDEVPTATDAPLSSANDDGVFVPSLAMPAPSPHLQPRDYVPV